MPDETILIVEDNDITRQGLQIILENGGYKILAASDGIEALKLMEATRPDFILSDIAMPGMDGYELYQNIRSRSEWVAIPFVFLTARGGREEIYKGKMLGIEDYLVKPIDREELLATIRSRLSRSQELMLAQLSQAYQASLIMFSNAIELRDDYTRGHVERVMEYAELIGRELGWNERQIEELKFGSILHDVGKIYIREAILRRPGPLSPPDWEEMKLHPLVGAELIKNIDYLEQALPVIRHHHERWDGKGYPDGLVGEQIPVMARVVAIADALDAMTSPRNYRTPAGAQQAYDEIVACAGSFYDPMIVKAFQNAWGKILPLMLKLLNMEAGVSESGKVDGSSGTDPSPGSSHSQPAGR
jgi:response regulator RpfG family c-di-GMP phosphodiesterase